MAQAVQPLKKRLAGFTVDDPDIVLLSKSLSGGFVPVGAVGVRSFEVLSNVQPVASVDASSRLKSETFFIRCPYSFVSAHTLLVCTPVRSLKNSKKIEESA